MDTEKESGIEAPLMVGEKIYLNWPHTSAEVGSNKVATGTHLHCRTSANVLSVTHLKGKKKHKFEYKLCLYKRSNEIISSRLKNIVWEKKLKKTEKRKVAVHTTSDMADSLGKRKKLRNRCANTSSGEFESIEILHSSYCHLKYIVAPMVGGSELAFRLLCRRYGATLAYTPMMSSEKFASDAEYREQEFQSCTQDRPLVAHFSANHPQTFLEAARLVQHKCDAIDLNLGCPQRIAHSGHFGSYLLNPEDRPLVLDIVRTLSQCLVVPMFVKIRLLDTVEDSIELCQQLVDAGVGLIAIHARYRVNLVGRTGPGARDGAAHLDQVRIIREAISSHVPIIANGNVISFDDVVANVQSTATQGIMSAEGLLDNPALFNGGEKVDKWTLAREYLELVDQYPVKLKSVIFHIRRMCREELTQYQLLEDCASAESVEQVKQIVEQGIHYRDHGGFEANAKKAQLAREALARRKHEESKRKDFEARMIRKAKREGRSDLEHYLNIGAEQPTEEVIQALKGMSPEDAFARWRERHSQHCYAFHMSAEGCPRDRRCAFLHADARVQNAVAYG